MFENLIFTEKAREAFNRPAPTTGYYGRNPDQWNPTKEATGAHNAKDAIMRMLLLSTLTEIGRPCQCKEIAAALEKKIGEPVSHQLVAKNLLQMTKLWGSSPALVRRYEEDRGGTREVTIPKWGWSASEGYHVVSTETIEVPNVVALYVAL